MSMVLHPSYMIAPCNNWYSSVQQGFQHSVTYPINCSSNEEYSLTSQNVDLPQLPVTSHFAWKTLNHVNIATEWTTNAYSRPFTESITQTNVSFNHIQSIPEIKRDLDSVLRLKNAEIWRPFSPSPPRHAPYSTKSFNYRHEKSKFIDRMNLPTITPSKVKIGLSKTSVFKAVKKKSYNCPQCSSRYISVAQLSSHMRVHTGIKPYACEYPNCSKTFARNEELTRHRRIHSGYKPHLCSICEKGFGRKDHLSKHLKTHLQVSEKKVYVCSISGCGHRYTRSDALTRHKSTAHAIRKTSANSDQNSQNDTISE